LVASLKNDDTGWERGGGGGGDAKEKQIAGTEKTQGTFPYQAPLGKEGALG